VSVLRRTVDRIKPDTAPLRTSRDFRLLLAAGTVFSLGGMVSYVAVPFQLYHLTHSNLAVGAMGAAELVPLLLFGLYGGALADHADRRTVLIGTGLAQVLLTAGLMTNALLHHPRIWLIYLLGALLAVAGALQRPSLEALTPRVVRHDEVPAAAALSSLGQQIGMFVGPALGGLLVATAGAGPAFGVDVAGLTIATVLFTMLRRYPASEGSRPPSLSGIVEGVRYAASRKDLLGSYVVDIIAMFLAYPIVLFPALAANVFRQPELLGALYTAESVGTLIATSTSGWTSRVHHHGRAIVLAATAYGAAVALVGLAPNTWTAVALLAVAGAADMISGLFRHALWNQTIPDGMRGRLAGIEMLSYSVGPLGGQARAGLVADLTSVRVSIVSGGLLCVAGVGATATALRSFWRYDARTDEHAARERTDRAARAARAATPD
jgi:MFS family permease